MKKTIITLLALAGMASAVDTDITLLYGLDFNKTGTANNSGGVLYENKAEEAGTGSINTVGSGFRNYVTGMDGTKASDIRGASYYYQINSAKDSTTGLGVNTTDGFTLTFNANFITNDDWTSFMEFNIGGQSLVFQWGDYNLTSVNVFTKEGGAAGTGTGETAKLSAGSIAKETWYNIALVAKNGSLTLSAFDSSGKLISTDTVTAAYTGNLNSVSGYTDYKFTKSYIDNLAIYDGALTADQLSTLTKYEMANQTVMQIIPEPTTATLSLFALAGLAARRRRR